MQIVSQEIKLGWDGDALFMQVHPPLEENYRSAEELKKEALLVLEKEASERPFKLIGKGFTRAFEKLDGIPVEIGRAVPEH